MFCFFYSIIILNAFEFDVFCVVFFLSDSFLFLSIFLDLKGTSNICCLKNQFLLQQPAPKMRRLNQLDQPRGEPRVTPKQDIICNVASGCSLFPLPGAACFLAGCLGLNSLVVLMVNPITNQK